MQRGETLEHVATSHGCSTEVVLRANHRDNTLVPAGTVVVVPDCRQRTASRPVARRTADSDDGDDADERARAALATIDGASLVERPSKVTEVADDEPASTGEPWDGTLEHGEPLPQGDGYVVRRPNRAYGEPHVIDKLQDVIAEVRDIYPDLHTLAIGDLSRRGGGRLAGHVSHQTGLDVDVGFYFTALPAGYPDAFHAADDTLDRAATWALLAAFARSADEPVGVQVIFLDYDVQARLHAYAKTHGATAAQLERVNEYPLRGRDEAAGIVRHRPCITRITCTWCGSSPRADRSPSPSPSPTPSPTPTPTPNPAPTPTPIPTPSYSALQPVQHAALLVALGRVRRLRQHAERGGDIERGAELAQAAERDAEQVEAIATAATARLCDVERHARQRATRLPREVGVVTAQLREWPRSR